MAATATPDEVFNPNGKYRVVVTKDLPGKHWREIFEAADCRVEIWKGTSILTQDELRTIIGDKVDGVLGQLTEPWDEKMLTYIKERGCKAYSNMAVGYNNIDMAAANKLKLPIGNTPGVSTAVVSELTLALTLAAMRRIVEADTFMRAGKYTGWLPTMFLGKHGVGGTVGVIGCGRIGSEYARMMAEGLKMNIIYYDIRPATQLEAFVKDYADVLEKHGEKRITCKRVDTVEEVLRTADVVSLNTLLDDTTRHMINAERLNMMKKDAVLVNCARGPVIDEKALVAHCKANPDFRVGLDVFEDEPKMAPGLAELPNVVVAPHIGSAALGPRADMAALAAANVAGIIRGYPVVESADANAFVDGPIQQKTPFIVNAKDIGLL